MVLLCEELGGIVVNNAMLQGVAEYNIGVTIVYYVSSNSVSCTNYTSFVINSDFSIDVPGFCCRYHLP